MKKISLFVFIVVTGIFLYFIFSFFNTSSEDKNVKTQLLNAIEVEHPAYVSVFEPNSEQSAELFSNKDVRKTSLQVMNENIDSVLERNMNAGGGNYYTVTSDSINKNKIRVIITAPQIEIKNYREEQILLSYIMYASPEVVDASSTSLVFELQCLNDVPRTKDIYLALSCVQVEESLKMMSETLNITNIDALTNYVKNEDEDNAKLLELELKRLEEYKKPEQSQDDIDVVASTNCERGSLYGFVYFVEPNMKIVCYENNILVAADPDTLIPLESLSKEMTQFFVPNKTVENDFDFAFDKNNFFINGDIAYSSAMGTFEVNKMPEAGGVGSVIINGRDYDVIMMGLVGATLK